MSIKIVPIEDRLGITIRAIYICNNCQERAFAQVLNGGILQRPVGWFAGDNPLSKDGSPEMHYCSEACVMAHLGRPETEA